jgi:arylsulfatase A-like enzyme
MPAMSRVWVCVLLSLFSFSAAAQEKPSVIVIAIDSLRPDHLQTYGYGRATSPEILRFSQRATVFTNAYSSSSWTRPAVESLMTGQYSSELNLNPGGGTPLKDGHGTIATVLHSYGYGTAAIYHSPQLTKPLMNLQGFDEDTDYGQNDSALTPYVARGIDRALSYLQSKSKPVFLLFHLLDPHMPYAPKVNHFGRTPVNQYGGSWVTPDPDCDKNRAQTCNLALKPELTGEMQELYDSEIAELDAELGRLFRYLDATPRYKNAFVVLTADHGEEFVEHGGLYHGARLYEETIRIPLIVRSPQRPYSAGRRVDSFVSLVDLAPTILQAAGIAFEESDYSGRTLIPFLGRRAGVPRATVFIEKLGCACEYASAVRSGDWKMIVHTQPKQRIELYDLRNDPREKNDLANSKRAAAQRAKAMLAGKIDAWTRHVLRPLATRADDTTPPIPARLRNRLKALGYIH